MNPKRAFRVGLTYEFGRYPQGLIDKRRVRREQRESGGAAASEAEESYALKPIRWIIAEVDIEKRQALLIAKKGLDCRPCHGEAVYPGWEASELRRWLNDGFLRAAFSPEEISRLLPTGAGGDGSLSGGEGAEGDRVFILGREEALRYLPAIDERSCELTAYAFSRGGYCDGQGHCCWWLRTAPEGAENEGKCGVISYGGGAYAMPADFAHNCVRPAVRIVY